MAIDRDPEAPSAPAGLTITATIVDARGFPVPGAALFLADRRFRFATSDAMGRIDATHDVRDLLVPDQWLEAQILSEGHAGERRGVPWSGNGSRVVLGTIVLEPGCDLEGRAVTASGAPAAGLAIVWVELLDVPAGELPARDEEHRRFRRYPEFRVRAESDADGRFVLRGAPLGPCFLQASGERHGIARTDAFWVTDVRHPSITILVPEARDPRPIRGIVRDPSGLPVAGSTVRLLEADHLLAIEGVGRRTESDGTGAFAFEVFEDAEYLLQALPVGGDAYPVVRDGVRPGDTAIELQFGAPRWTEVVPVDASGEPIPWSNVRTTGAQGYPKRDLIPCGRAGTARVLVPRESFRIEAFAPGFRTEVVGPFEPEEVGERLEVTMRAGAAVHGRVTFQGRPVAGAAITASSTFAADRTEYSRTVARPESPFVVVAASFKRDPCGTTDSEGRFAVSLHHDGRHTLRVEADGFPRSTFGPFDWSLDAVTTGVDVELARGGSLTGQVHGAPGASLDGLVVGASNGFGFAHTCTVDEEGRYLLEDLQPGSWQVRPCLGPAEPIERLHTLGVPGRPAIRWDCEVRAGQVTEFDLDLSNQGSCVLRGCIRISGEPAAGWDLCVKPADSFGSLFAPNLARTSLDDEGCFEVSLSASGRYELRASALNWMVLAEVQLSPGVTEWEADLETGTVVLAGQPPSHDNGRPVRFLQLRAHGDEDRVVFRRYSVSGLADGPLRLTDAPLGRGTVLREVSSAGLHGPLDDRRWAVLAEFVLTPGAEARVDL